jgi:hypothetical protein
MAAIDTTAVELARAIRDRDCSAVELVQALLDRIERRNPALNAIVTLDAKGALERAGATRSCWPRRARSTPWWAGSARHRIPRTDQKKNPCACTQGFRGRLPAGAARAACFVLLVRYFAPSRGGSLVSWGQS